MLLLRFRNIYSESPDWLAPALFDCWLGPSKGAHDGATLGYLDSSNKICCDDETFGDAKGVGYDNVSFSLKFTLQLVQTHIFQQLLKVGLM